MLHEKLEKLEQLTRPLIKFLNEEFEEYMTVVVTPTDAELFESVCSLHDSDNKKQS